MWLHWEPLGTPTTLMEQNKYKYIVLEYKLLFYLNSSRTMQVSL